MAEHDAKRLLAIKRQAHGGLVPPRAGQDHVGPLRHGPERRRPAEGASSGSRSCATSSGGTSTCPASDAELNQALEKAGRVADFLELGELMCLDALAPRGVVRRPLPRGVPDAGRRGAARRRAVRLRRRLGVSRARDKPERLHKEPLEFENVHLAQRSYK